MSSDLSADDERIRRRLALTLCYQHAGDLLAPFQHLCVWFIILGRISVADKSGEVDIFRTSIGAKFADKFVEASDSGGSRRDTQPRVRVSQ
ncbi:MAG TPA: hypothetical protein VGC60_18300 [Pyrinomonadaceae bacterium]